MGDEVAKKRMIFDDWAYNDPAMFEDTREAIALQEGLSVEDVADNAVYDELNKLRLADWEQALEELDTDCWNSLVAHGSSGRWDGTSYGYTFAESPSELLHDTGYYGVFKDCQDFTIWDENGSLFMSGTHHDGSVDLEVHWLTDAGQELLDEHMYGSEFDDDSVLKTIFESEELSGKPNFAHFVYGVPEVENEPRITGHTLSVGKKNDAPSAESKGYSLESAAAAAIEAKDGRMPLAERAEQARVAASGHDEV